MNGVRTDRFGWSEAGGVTVDNSARTGEPLLASWLDADDDVASDPVIGKGELVARVALASGIPQAMARKLVAAMLDEITSALAEGKDVQLRGFGTFAVAERSASHGRNPRTGKPITVPARSSPRFKPGKALKEAVN